MAPVCPVTLLDLSMIGLILSQWDPIPAAVQEFGKD